MIDKFKIKPSALRVRDDALQRKRAPDGFQRFHRVASNCAKDSIHFYFMFGKYQLVRMRCFKAKDGSWWVSGIESNVPALLAGHNGGLPVTVDDIALALTRLRFIVGLIVTPETLHGAIPLGDSHRGNNASLEKAEIFWQFDDPSLRFLIASHQSCFKNQQKPNCVYHGESTRMHTRELVVSIYDKRRQSKDGVLLETCSSSVRFEVQYRCTARLLKDAAGVHGRPENGSLATLSPDAIHALLGLTHSRMLGFGWSAAPKDLSGLSPVALTIIASADERLFRPHGVDAVLNDYRTAMAMLPTPRSERTLSKVEKEVRAWVANHHLARNFDPSTPIHALPPSPLSKPWVEEDYARLMDSLGAPSVPDPDILAAWSETRFLPRVPKDRDQVGHVVPSPPPFRDPTLI